MLEKEELSRLYKIHNNRTFLFKKPSWLKFYCLCYNENVLTILKEKEYNVFFVISTNKNAEYYKEKYKKIDENPNKKIINRHIKIYDKY